MKSILISIQPKWCEKIASGEKTIEVRKSAPKEVPFKVYIYCTKHGKQFFHNGLGEKECLFKNPDTGKIKFDYAFEVMCCKNDYSEDNFLSGKVIGEFICDKVYPIKNRGSSFSVADEEQSVTNEIARQSCLYYDDMVNYFGNKDGFGWHISDLKIYDKPKELSEFKKYYECGNNSCGNCNKCDKDYHLTRPPQSWCYVEELQEKNN